MQLRNVERKWAFCLFTASAVNMREPRNASRVACTGCTSQIRHPWDETGAGPESFPNHGYGTERPK
jgi:hypothetical protein